MFKKYFTGFRIALSGFQYLAQSGLRRYILIPLFINISLFAGIFWYSASKLSYWVDEMSTLLPSWLQWLNYIFWPLFIFVAMLIIFYTFTLAANFIAAPFNSFFSEKLETRISGSKPPSSGRTSTVASIKNSFASELQKLGYLMMWIIPLLILTIIPVINIMMPLAWIVFGAWMLSLEYLDYPMSNHGIEFPAQRNIIKQHRPAVLGFGTCIVLMTAIPILNFFAMPVAVAGATRLWVLEISKTGYLK